MKTADPMATEAGIYEGDAKELETVWADEVDVGGIR